MGRVESFMAPSRSSTQEEEEGGPLRAQVGLKERFRSTGAIEERLSS